MTKQCNYHRQVHEICTHSPSVSRYHSLLLQGARFVATLLCEELVHHVKHACYWTDGHPLTKLSLTRTGFQKYSDGMCLNDWGLQGNAVLLLVRGPCRWSPGPEMRDSKLASLLYWWKEARERLVLCWAQWTKITKCMGWPTGFVRDIRKFSQETIDIIFAFWFSSVVVRFSD